MDADAARDAWIDKARAVRIEDELARRGIKNLKGKTERAGPCPHCKGDDRFSINTKKQVFNCRHCGAKGRGSIDFVMFLDGSEFNDAVETLTGEPPPPPPKANGHGANGTKRAQQSGGKKEIAETYEYLDADSTLAFKVVRFHFRKPDGSLELTNSGKLAKSFGQCRPDPDDPNVSIWGLNAGEFIRRGPGQDWVRFDEEKWDKFPAASRQRKTVADAAKLVPYKLPGIIEAIDKEQTLFIVEGEQKVDALAKWNATATCCAQGAGKWTAEHATYLQGADVVILPDNDDSGRSHAEVVAQSLQGKVTRICVLELPGLGAKGDIVDWIAAGHSREELDRLVEAAPEWKPAAAAGAGGDEEEPDFKAAMQQMSETYALIIVGGNAAILEETGDDYRLLTTGAFKQWFSNKTVTITSGNKAAELPIAETWLKSKARRSYSGIVFAPNRTVPGAYNLWRGFPVKPVKGDCSKFLAHIRDNVCRGDDELYKWVIAWMADIFQNPGSKVGTSLALRGKMGSGKTIVGKYLRALLGVYYWLVEHSDHVTGKFNAHHSRLLLLHCDEAFWAGDKAGLGRLRSMITGDKTSIEFKGKDLIQVDSFMRLLVTGDDRWVVPAGLRERRFAVLDVGEKHLQDHEYFAAIEHEMNHGGSQALLWHLLNVDLSKVNLHQIPQTAALQEQKVASMDQLHGWWLDLLRQGELPGDHDGAGITPRELLFSHYIEHARRIGANRKSIETQLGCFIKAIAPGTGTVNETVAVQTIDRLGNHSSHAYRGTYHLPTLVGCRDELERQCGTIDWEGCPDAWQQATPKRGRD